MSEAVAVPVRIHKPSPTPRDPEQERAPRPRDPVLPGQAPLADPLAAEAHTGEPGAAARPAEPELAADPDLAADAVLSADPESPEQYQQLQQKVRELLGDIERLQRHGKQEQQRARREGEDLAVRVVAPALAALEQARRQLASRDDAVARGLMLARDGLEAALESAGYHRIPDEGERFDPRCHEAVVCQPGQGSPIDTVLHSLSPGFERDGEIVVPARVVVASQGAQPEDPE